MIFDTLVSIACARAFVETFIIENLLLLSLGFKKKLSANFRSYYEVCCPQLHEIHFEMFLSILVQMDLYLLLFLSMDLFYFLWRGVGREFSYQAFSLDHLGTRLCWSIMAFINEVLLQVLFHCSVNTRLCETSTLYRIRERVLFFTCVGVIA